MSKENGNGRNAMRRPVGVLRQTMDGVTVGRYAVFGLMRAEVERGVEAGDGCDATQSFGHSDHRGLEVEPRLAAVEPVRLSGLIGRSGELMLGMPGPNTKAGAAVEGEVTAAFV